MKRFLVFCFLLGASVPLAALDPLEPATVRVTVDDRGSGTRQEALREGLREVLTRVTGLTDAAERDELAHMLRDPNQWLEHYGYREGDEGLLLEARFGLQAVRRAVRDAGIRVWGPTRPRVLLWLVDERGNIVSAGDDTGAIHEALARRGQYRGLPMRLPEMDAEDRSEIVAADIRGRFDRRLRAASARYDLPLVAAAVFYTGDQPYLRWRLLQHGEPLDEGRVEVGEGDGEPRARLAAALVDRLADRVAGLYAVTAGEPVRVSLRVEGIGSLERFASLRQHAVGLAGVETLSISRLEGGALEAGIEFSGPPEQLERLLRLHRRLGDCPDPAPLAITEMPEDAEVETDPDAPDAVPALRLCWREA